MGDWGAEVGIQVLVKPRLVGCANLGTQDCSKLSVTILFSGK